jgi:hypothetical protein
VVKNAFDELILFSHIPVVKRKKTEMGLTLLKNLLGPGKKETGRSIKTNQIHKKSVVTD